MAPSVWGRKQRFRPTPGAVLLGLVVLGALAFGLTRLQLPVAPLTGRAEAIDGDTLRMGSVRVRLMGLDAPELDQTCTRADGSEWSCGSEAKAALAVRLRAGAIDCARYGRDIYGRTLAKCSAGGADLAADMVRAGWAVSDDDYLYESAAARAQQLGIWSGRFDHPIDWRRRHGADQPGPWEWIRSWFQ